ncbi:hypothetical protein HC762_00815 [bacterium]|nr:hypothetical protein [bacterium]
MATELTVQSERAFQKQPHIFTNQKSKATKSKKIGKGGRRWYKDIGLGFKTPKEAINGSYIGTIFSRSGFISLEEGEHGEEVVVELPTRELAARIRVVGIVDIRRRERREWSFADLGFWISHR